MIKTSKIILKIAAILISIAAILFLAVYLKYNSTLPKGIKGEKASTLAFNISKSIGYEAYEHTNFISWNVNGYFYKWNKKNKVVDVKWGKNHVLYNQNEPQKSILISPKNSAPKIIKKLITKAESKFNNDSFWLVAPFKLFDKGVELSYIEASKTENASLLVTYKSGGTTPGDSYQWFVDEKFVPTHFKMWVQIIPIGGVPAIWTNWKTMQPGFKLAHKKKILDVITFPMQDIKAWNTN